jgi:hypothetical protein
MIHEHEIRERIYTSKCIAVHWAKFIDYKFLTAPGDRGTKIVRVIATKGNNTIKHSNITNQCITPQ